MTITYTVTEDQAKGRNRFLIDSTSRASSTETATRKHIRRHNLERGHHPFLGNVGPLEYRIFKTYYSAPKSRISPKPGYPTNWLERSSEGDHETILSLVDSPLEPLATTEELARPLQRRCPHEESLPCPSQTSQRPKKRKRFSLVRVRCHRLFVGVEVVPSICVFLHEGHDHLVLPGFSTCHVPTYSFLGFLSLNPDHSM